MKATFNHVGIGVGDINAAVAFYCGAFGCRLVGGILEIGRDGPQGAKAVDVLSSRPFHRMKVAKLIMSDGVGIELFELLDPPHEAREPKLEYWKSGTFHFCVTALDFDESLQRIVELGGRQTSRCWQQDPCDPNKRMVYCADPWGTEIELYSHPFAVIAGA